MSRGSLNHCRRLKARILITLEVANTLHAILPRCATSVEVSALAAGAPLVMSLGARGWVSDEMPQVLHAGATQMLDGSIAPRRTQLVIDVFLADIPAMTECLAKLRRADVLRVRPVGFEDEATHLASALEEMLHVEA